MTHDSRLRHNAFVYASTDEYVGRAAAFLGEGLAAGEGAIVAHTRPGIAVMREALGDAARHVTFVDVSEAYTRPAHTLAAYHDVYARQLGRTPSLRAVADVQVGPEPREWDLWTGYEAVFNRSFAHLPAWVLCSYDANGLPDPVLEGVWQTHPEVVGAAGWSASERFADPDALLLGSNGAAAAPLPGLRSLGACSDVETLRERLAAELVEVPGSRALDMLLAASEVFANALTHGRGVRDVRVGRADGRLVCEIVDAGEGFEDPAAGFLAPRPGVGTGLWVARQRVWDIEFLRAPAGFTARIRL
jgi:anti-sigma regulatory factor (Ser/Thr protein kinase)